MKKLSIMATAVSAALLSFNAFALNDFALDSDIPEPPKPMTEKQVQEFFNEVRVDVAPEPVQVTKDPMPSDSWGASITESADELAYEHDMIDLQNLIEKQNVEIKWLTRRMNKLVSFVKSQEKEKVEINKDAFGSYKFAEYKPKKSNLVAGDDFKLFGYNHPMTPLNLGDDPFFNQLKDLNITMPYPQRGCCKDGIPIIRTGFSSYPRAYLPFSNVYGPVSHRVKFQKATIDGFKADYAIGVMSDYGNNFISAVINIQIEEGLFFVVRVGYNQLDGSYKSIDPIAKEIHRFMDSMILSKK